jgi:hypothetical protein
MRDEGEYARVGVIVSGGNVDLKLLGHLFGQSGQA